MKQVNVADFKAHLSEYLEAVESGEEIALCRRNTPIATITSIPRPRKNQTRLGWCAGGIKIHGDITEPAIPVGDWDMLKP